MSFWLLLLRFLLRVRGRAGVMSALSPSPVPWPLPSCLRPSEPLSLIVLGLSGLPAPLSRPQPPGPPSRSAFLLHVHRLAKVIMGAPLPFPAQRPLSSGLRPPAVELPTTLSVTPDRDAPAAIAERAVVSIDSVLPTGRADRD